MPYIEIPLETEPTDLAELAFEYLEDKVPGWLPSPGNLEAWLVESNSLLAGELRDLAALVPDSIFEYFGSSVLGLPPLEATPAVGATTWTARDTAGYTVPAGTLVGISPPATGETLAFQTVQDAVIEAGQTQVAPVGIVAVEPGAAATGITGTVEPLDSFDFIESVTLNAATNGGVDEETTEAYLGRLSDLFTLLSPRPILPQDFAVIAQRADASIARATAIDLYNPGPPVDANCPRCVTVAMTNAEGDPVTTEVKTAVDAQLQAMREVNFLVFVRDPTYTIIDATAHVVSYHGYNEADVEALVQETLENFLSPANWGLPLVQDNTRAGTWVNETVLRYLDLTAAVDHTDGVDYIVDFTFGVQGGPAQAKTDITLTGVAPLPKPGTFTIDVDIP